MNLLKAWLSHFGLTQREFGHIIGESDSYVIVCRSDNPAYENYTLNRDTTQVYGRVVWVGRTLV